MDCFQWLTAVLIAVLFFNVFIPTDQYRYICNSEKAFCFYYYYYYFYFRLKPFFLSADMSKFKDGRLHFRNSGTKGFMSETTLAIVIVNKNKLKKKIHE